IFGAILIARIMIPGDKITGVDEMSEDGLSYDSTVDAITTGTTFGVRLVVNVGAMLIALIALVALVNLLLGWADTSIRELFGMVVSADYEPLTLATILGWVFAPLAWAMGIEWQDAAAAGSLLGSKFVLNELVAYFQLGEIGPSLQPHTNLIMTYALCGFTNLGSVGILIGGVSTIVPERRDELLQLGPRTLISGTLVACLTGTIAGLLHLF
ncbi:MAG: nucleoside:proton symporter, partial [Gammaproteobacteria bacterium]|nr:nucleoside:proton symporter [Gammaproteobacteria bacterium]